VKHMERYLFEIKKDDPSSYVVDIWITCVKDDNLNILWSPYNRCSFIVSTLNFISSTLKFEFSSY
jgi:hypothetical protein